MKIREAKGVRSCFLPQQKGIIGPRIKRQKTRPDL